MATSMAALHRHNATMARAPGASHRNVPIAPVLVLRHDTASRCSAQRSLRCASVAQVAEAAQPSAQLASTWVSSAARKGMFATAAEHVTPVDAQVTGTIPSWVSGDLLANGGGNYEGMVHMFDGLAMMTKLSVRDGRVQGTQRFIQTQQYTHVQRTRRLKWREFATPLPSSSLLEKAGQVAENLAMLAANGPGTTDNASVNLIPLADGTLMAASEPLTAVYRVDQELRTLNQINLAGDGVPGQILTAHPKLLRDGKTLVNFSHSVPAGGLHVYKQDTTTLARTQIAFIRDASPFSPAWIHDFSVSENHAVIVEPPLLFNMPSLVLGSSTDYLFMDWMPEQRTRIHVVKLDGSGAVTHTCPPFFTFHHANAFEEGGAVHVDLCGYDGPKVVNDLSLEPLQSFPGQNISESRVWRLSIPLHAAPGTLLPAPRQLLQTSEQHGGFAEFPAVNPAVRMRKHRYVYSLSAVRPTNMGNALAKHDLQDGTSRLWHESGCAPGEPVFVAAPNAVDEDDGVVLCMVMGAQGKSFLLCLDARTWTELGRAELPYAIPYRFHGTWLPATP